MSSDLLDASSARNIEKLESRLRRRQLVGSRESAMETVLVLRQMVSKARFHNIEELVVLIKDVGRRLVAAQPKEHSVGNIVRRVLHHIREEYNAVAKTSPSKKDFSISTFILLGQPRKQASSSKTLPESSSREFDPTDPEDFSKGLKPVLMEAIQDVLDELETAYDNVSKGAKDHIHSDEIVLTIGMSKTVEAFLKSAAHHRKFTVLVAETAPSYSGHEMARKLSSAGISTILIPDSSLYAVMSRVNKVVLGAHAILADGGMFAVTGALLAATAARAHSTPVVVCAGQFKLTPLWNIYHDHGAFDFADPRTVLGFDEGDLIDKVEVLNPFFDYVRPELVDVFITSDGDHPPSSVHRLIKETYDDEDYEL